MKEKLLSPYSKKTFEVLLDIFGVPLTSAVPLPHDDKLHQFELYARPLSEITSQFLIEDNVTYLLQHLQISYNRRVCFLFLRESDPFYALVVQLAELNANVLNQLQQHLQESKLNKLKEIVKNPYLIKLFKSLYSKVHLLFLGSSSNDTLLQQLYPAIQNAYSGQVRLDFKAINPLNRSILLLEDCLTMLKMGQTHDVSSVKAFCRHREKAVAVLLKAIEDIRSSDKVLYEAIFNSLTIIFKYQYLHRWRLEKGKISDATPEALKQWLLEDEYVKCLIYENSGINLESCLSSLEMLPIVQMLVLKDNPLALLEQLQKAQEYNFQALQSWEQDVEARIQKQSWLSYVKEKSLNTATFLYQHSLVQLGFELVPWIGCSLAKYLPSKIAPYASSEVAIKVYQGAGIGVGFLLTYAGGSYFVLRSFAITAVALKATAYFQKNYLDDKNARTMPQAKYQFSSITCFRMMSMGLSIVESIYWGDIQPILHSMGGVGGSMALIEVTQKLSTPIKKLLTQGTKEERMLATLLLTSAGHDLGYLLSHYIYTGKLLPIIFHYQKREQIVKQLYDVATQKNIDNFLIREVSSFETLKKCITQEDSIQFEWQSRQSFFYQANCKILNHPVREPLDALQCTITESPACLKNGM